MVRFSSKANETDFNPRRAALTANCVESDDLPVPGAPTISVLVPRSSPPHVLSPLLRPAYADTLLDDASGAPARDPADPPSPLRLLLMFIVVLIAIWYLASLG